jgi:hypothetical protein
MAIRNFWIEVHIDGRKTVLKGGPQSKNGGMRVNIFQRDHGMIKQSGHIQCQSDGLDLITFGLEGGPYRTRR